MTGTAQQRLGQAATAAHTLSLSHTHTRTHTCGGPHKRASLGRGGERYFGIGILPGPGLCRSSLSAHGSPPQYAKSPTLLRPASLASSASELGCADTHAHCWRRTHVKPGKTAANHQRTAHPRRPGGACSEREKKIKAHRRQEDQSGEHKASRRPFTRNMRAMPRPRLHLPPGHDCSTILRCLVRTFCSRQIRTCSCRARLRGAQHSRRGKGSRRSIDMPLVVVTGFPSSGKTRRCDVAVVSSPRACAKPALLAGRATCCVRP